MRTIAFFSKTLPSKIADEVRAAGYTVLRPLEIAEVMYQCEHQGVEVVVIASDVDEDERAAVQFRWPTIILRPGATTTELLFELSNVFPESRVWVN